MSDDNTKKQHQLEILEAAKSKLKIAGAILGTTHPAKIKVEDAINCAKRAQYMIDSNYRQRLKIHESIDKNLD